MEMVKDVSVRILEEWLTSVEDVLLSWTDVLSASVPTGRESAKLRGFISVFRSARERPALPDEFVSPEDMEDDEAGVLVEDSGDEDLGLENASADVDNQDTVQEDPADAQSDED
ncbi:hypothetical protein THARTR1_06605 [Trichoderma harzianum]|uniref:Uncharacterized protein n=1 Tax=Trichoderma harzianum TaxID=5544 RepID=A0A2K0U4S3_TRIHA|nr:hypothetical protein THARTR1_06605 [Trichoderma harzianum]